MATWRIAWGSSRIRWQVPFLLHPFFTWYADITGVLKFNALLEWLQSHLPSSGSQGQAKTGSAKQQKPLKTDPKAAKANAARAQEALESEMIRDGKGTGTEAAPDAQPAEGVEDGDVQSSRDAEAGGAADPVPGGGLDDEVVGDEEAAEAGQTQRHEEL